MIDFNLIEKAIYDWVSGASGLPTIWENQNAPAPSANYITLALLSAVDIGHDAWAPVNQNKMSRILSDKTLDIRIQCFSNNAISILDHIGVVTKLEQYSSLFHTAGITLLQKGKIQNLTGLGENDQFTQRAAMDAMFLLTTISDELDLSTIEGVEINGTIKVGSSTIKELQIINCTVNGLIQTEHLLEGSITSN